MTVEQLSRGNEITNELNKLHEKIKERVSMYDILDGKQENSEEIVWVSFWGVGGYFEVNNIKDFMQTEIKSLRARIKELEAEFLNL